YIAFPTLVRYKITPPQPSPYQGDGARQRGWGVFHELGNCYIYTTDKRYKVIDASCKIDSDAANATLILGQMNTQSLVQNDDNQMIIRKL
ncbi:hypothetical protein, partial [Anabaena sp. PCC 7938]|uniref:hypothetical protein n=1 Tax=Anabaena sp. PCC 7938 TaxID=1296340 RepID=UPI00202F769C